MDFRVNSDCENFGDSVFEIFNFIDFLNIRRFVRLCVSKVGFGNTGLILIIVVIY